MKIILKISVALAFVFAIFFAISSCEIDECDNTLEGKTRLSSSLVDSEAACCNYANEKGYKYFCYKNGDCYGYNEHYSTYQ